MTYDNGYKNQEEFTALLEEIKEELEFYGLELDDAEVTISDVADYIITAGGPKVYGVLDWINDTQDNYPECFK